MIDDAAISMAYASNWAHGHGLVAQPGAEPVEGYSNFLWVVLLAGLDIAGAMTIPIVKALSAALVGLSLISLLQTCRVLIPDQPATHFVVVLLVATSSAIVTWTTSGLENPLTLLLSCELLRVVSEASLRSLTARSASYAGALVAAMALNRPDGIAFAAFPMLVLVSSDRRWLVWRYAFVIAAIYGSFLLFRFSTFGDWAPNTFHAKEGGSLSLNALTFNAADLLNAPFGTGLVLIALFFLALLGVRRDASFSKRLLPPLLMMTVAGGVFILMPPDWMPDRRFGTPFLPAAFLFAGLVVSTIADVGLRRTALLGLVLFALLASLLRLTPLYREPTVPASFVQQTSDRFDARARLLGIDHGSLLLADLGAALRSSHLQIYDLAGLTDRTIARALPNDRARFNRYILDEVRPTFIKTNGPWAERAALDEVAKFRREYVPIHEEVDQQLLEQGIIRVSGEYVRRDALGSPGDLDILRKLR